MAKPCSVLVSATVVGDASAKDTRARHPEDVFQIAEIAPSMGVSTKPTPLSRQLYMAKPCSVLVTATAVGDVSAKDTRVHHREDAFQTVESVLSRASGIQLILLSKQTFSGKEWIVRAPATEPIVAKENVIPAPRGTDVLPSAALAL